MKLKTNKILGFLMVFFMLLTLLSLSSCSILKDKKSSSNTLKTNKTEKTNDSTSTVETSKPIKDNIVINVPKSDNPEVNEKLSQILQSLNTSKTSGTNSYKSTYDPETNRLLIEYLISETKNKQINVKSDTNTFESFEQKTDEYIYKKVKRVPIWAWIVLVLWFLPSIIERAKLIINPLSALIKKP